jgi:gluconolactonase
MRSTRFFAATLFGLAAFSLTASAQQLLPGENNARVTAIPGVVAAGARWQSVWADYVSADGIVGTSDGGVIFAQEQSDSIKKLMPDGTEYTFLEDLHGIGSVSLDVEGRLFGVERTCTEPLNSELAGCNILTRVVQLTPERRLLANSFADGRPFGRLNDLIADGNGGAFFTVGGAFHVNRDGLVSVVEDQNIRSNGIMLSRDGRVLYVTNRTAVLAFDVARDGSTSNRRVFAELNGDDGGDGMAIDSEGRLYVTANTGVHVLSRNGDYLGVIPTPRRAITIAFSGPNKQTLYVPQVGAIGADGQSFSNPEGVRTIGMTIYTLQMQSRGYEGRPK